MIDCVFKALLGSEENKSQLIHFLNSILGLVGENIITDVKILNPYNEKEFTGDKLTTVDLKARDQKGRSFQIDVQIAVPSWLTEKILFYWASVYKSQLQEGEDYSALQPTISIWLLENKLFDTNDPTLNDMYLDLNFQVYEPNAKISLSDHLNIHVIQLPFFKKDTPIINDKQRWLYFFKEGQNLEADKLPNSLNTEEIKKAMKTLAFFSEDEKARLLYSERLEAEREALTVQRTIEKTQAELTKSQEALLQSREALLHSKSEIVQKNNIITSMGGRLQQKDSQIQQQDSQIQQKDSQIQQKDSQIQQKDSQIQQRDRQIQYLIDQMKKSGIAIDNLQHRNIR